MAGETERWRVMSLGVAVIGCGRIGGLRASLSSTHPGVELPGDLRPGADSRRMCSPSARVRTLVTTDNLAAITDDRVDAVFVSTPEHDHRDSIVQALEAGKAVFVEKPIALTLADAGIIIEAAERSGSELRVGYSRRHDRRWMMTKEQILQGRLGEILGMQSRVYNTRAQLMQILARSLTQPRSTDVLTYYVDMACWFLEGIRPVEVVARSKYKIFRNWAYNASDVTWAIITFENGAVVNLGSATRCRRPIRPSVRARALKSSVMKGLYCSTPTTRTACSSRTVVLPIPMCPITTST